MDMIKLSEPQALQLQYLRAPLGVWENRGTHIQAQLAGWGEAVFASVFGSEPGRRPLAAGRDHGRWQLVPPGQHGVAVAFATLQVDEYQVRVECGGDFGRASVVVFDHLAFSR